MLALNSKIKLNGEFSITDENYQTFLTNGTEKELLNEIGKMIINHHDNFRLKEIAIILQEFFQIDYNDAVNAIEGFVNRLIEKKIVSVINANEEFDIDEKSSFIRNSKIELIEDDDGTGVLKDFKLGKMLYLNKSGIGIWNYLVQQRLVSDIIKNVADEYDVEYENIKNDILSFMFTLLEKDFILLSEKA